MNRLLRMPVTCEELLQSAAEGDDPEVRWRARQVLEHANTKSEEILCAAFNTIHHKQIKGLAQPVLDAIPRCREEYLRSASGDALCGTVEPSDVDRLRNVLSGDDGHVRIAALTALAVLLGQDANDDLRPLLAVPDDRVAVAAARAMVNHGCREGLPALVRLLDSESLQIRITAVKVLRVASGKRFGFVAYGQSDARAQAKQQWLDWINTEGKTASLDIPLEDIRYELGRTLYCCYSPNKIFELDAAHNVVWELATGPHPWGCFGMPNGHRLIATYGDRVVTEYDASGKVVWKTNPLPGGPMSVERLDNDNTLIACTDSGQVVEIDRSKKTVWNITLSGRPTDARRLPDGRTLVTLQNAKRIVEVNRSGKVLWEISGLPNPISAQRLENGNTLACCIGGGKIAQYDRSGKEVWSKGGFRMPYYAQRMSNGNTLVTHSSGLSEIDPNGKEVWHKAASHVSKAHRY